jgi:Zn-dependent metalloprotease
MRNVVPLVLMLALILGPSLAAAKPAHTPPEIPTKAKSAIHRLNHISNGDLEIEWNAVTGTPSKITGTLARPSSHSPEWIAYSFLQPTRALYGLSNPKRDLPVDRIEPRGSGSVRVHLKRTLYGLPVFGNSLAIDIDQRGVVRQVEGAIHPHLERRIFHRPAQPAVTESEAMITALQSMPQYNAAGILPSIQLGYDPTRHGMPLVYAITFERTEDGGGYATETVYVHAAMGHIINAPLSDGSVDH